LLKTLGNFLDLRRVRIRTNPSISVEISKGDTSERFQDRKDSRGNKEKKTQGVKCYDCYGFGHIWTNSNYRKFKKKPLILL
jgi:hypothetical protein